MKNIARKKTIKNPQCKAEISDGNIDKKHDVVTFFCVREKGHKGLHYGHMNLSKKSGKILKHRVFTFG